LALAAAVNADGGPDGTDWAVDAGALAAVVAAALVCHAAPMRLVLRALDPRPVFLTSLLSQTRGPTRLALIIFAVSVAARRRRRAHGRTVARAVA
jgi:hypothetical protein